MEIVKVNINELIPYENNPRINDGAVEFVANSIKEFGFKVPIILDKNNVIVAGHTRYKASLKLGLKEVPCIYANDLNDDQIKAFRIADNKVSDYSLWDNKLLLDELEGLDNNIFTGFNESELFGEELNEKDLDFLNDIVEEIGKENLTIKYQCKNIDQFNDIMGYIESIEDNYE